MFLVDETGDSEEDRKARNLLNKFLGASIIMNATESAMAVAPDEMKVVTKTKTVSSPQQKLSQRQVSATLIIITNKKSTTQSN